jgi:hypothetical protein
MRECWSVIENRTGRKICECAEERDAMLLVSLDPHNKTYRKDKFILDQVITINSEGIKELPGQQGLPEGKESLPEQLNLVLPKGEQEPFLI